MQAQKAGRRDLSAFALKMIAIAAMLVDHIAWAFVDLHSPQGIAMHFVGRITGPVMFYFVVEGYHHTRNINRYMLRMAVFAVVSYLPFVYFNTGGLPTAQTFYPVGVIYTLLLGLAALRARNELPGGLARVLVIIGVFLLSLLGDWPLYGIAYILLFDMLRGSYARQAAGAALLVMVSALPAFLDDWAVAVIQLGQLLPLALLALYNGKPGGGGRVGKWFFYVFYPAHLLVLGVLKTVL